MVQVLPQFDPGGQAGQSFGQALQQGLQQGSQIGQLQGALQRASKAFSDPNTSPIEKSLAFIEATAGIPGSERYVSSVLPMLMNQAYTQQQFAPESQQGMTPEGQIRTLQGQLPGAAGTQQGQIGGQKGTLQGQTQPYQRPQQAEGFLGSVYSPEAIKREAERVAIATGNPQAYQDTFNRLKKESDLAEQRRNDILSRAQGLGYSDWELPLFAESANKYASEKDPEQLLKKTKADVDERLSSFKKLERFDFSSPRQVKNLGSVVRDIAKDPYLEAPIRQDLAKKGFSTYEIESLLHPLTPNEKKLIKESPRGTAFLANRGKATEKLHDMLEKEINADTSIVALARQLRIKGTPLEAVREGLRNMQSRLTERQKNELASVESRDFDKPSTFEIFYGAPIF